jgi:hypothetical protein
VSQTSTNVVLPVAARIWPASSVGGCTTMGAYRVVEMHIEERIPIHVVPLRTPERIQAAQEAEVLSRSR